MGTRFGPFEVDSARRLLLTNGVETHLTPKAFDLLTLLVGEAPRVVPKDELHQRLWPGTFVSDATLVGLVKELRRALDDHDIRTPIIRTAHGVGYACAVPVERGLVRPTPVSPWLVVGSRRLALTEGLNVIGRASTAAVLLNVGGVSRWHAQIVVGQFGATLEDLGSKNGTKIADRAITGRVSLHDGDQIYIGPVLIIYHASASGISTETVVAQGPA
jgi:DNA-binding winged helix-turn-helix (wHTH) protein